MRYRTTSSSASGNPTALLLQARSRCGVDGLVRLGRSLIRRLRSVADFPHEAVTAGTTAGVLLIGDRHHLSGGSLLAVLAGVVESDPHAHGHGSSWSQALFAASR